MTPCREWKGAKNAHGYGRKWDRTLKKVVYAHRWVVAQIHGWDAIEGKEVMHLCHNPRCFRFDHLTVGTHSENMKMARDIGVIGCQKLDAEMAEAIRQADGTQREIAEMFNISQSLVWQVLNGKVWA